MRARSLAIACLLGTGCMPGARGIPAPPTPPPRPGGRRARRRVPLRPCHRATAGRGQGARRLRPRKISGTGTSENNRQCSRPAACREGHRPRTWPMRRSSLRGEDEALGPGVAWQLADLRGGARGMLGVSFARCATALPGRADRGHAAGGGHAPLHRLSARRSRGRAAGPAALGGRDADPPRCRRRRGGAGRPVRERRGRAPGAGPQRRDVRAARERGEQKLPLAATPYRRRRSRQIRGSLRWSAATAGARPRRRGAPVAHRGAADMGDRGRPEWTRMRVEIGELEEDARARAAAAAFREAAERFVPLGSPPIACWRSTSWARPARPGTTAGSTSEAGHATRPDAQ
jgi:hypothetical protein